MKTPAPIALFVYRRPAATRRVLQSLAGCAGFADAEVTVFSDGARGHDDAAEVAETREIVRSCGLANVRLVERSRNHGLAASIIGGVGELCESSGAVVVVEDDLVLAPGFLEFVNRALVRYEHEERVFQVNGYLYPASGLPPAPDSVFLPFVGSWGWATWKRAWRRFDVEARAALDVVGHPPTARRFDLDGAFPFSRMLRRQMRGQIDSWAIRFYLSMFRAGGLALFPRRSLVANLGLGGQATHTRWFDDAFTTEPFEGRLETWPVQVAVDEPALAAVQAFLRRYRNPVAQLLRRLRGLWQKPR